MGPKTSVAWDVDHAWEPFPVPIPVPVSGAAAPRWRRIVAIFLGGLGRPLLALAANRAQLFLWIPVALSFGIGAYFAAPAEPGRVFYALALIIAGPGLVIWLRGAEVLRFPAAIVTLAALGFLLAGYRAQSVAAAVLGYRYYGPVEGRVMRIDRGGSDQIRITLDQVRLDRLAPENIPARVRISLYDQSDDPPPEPGERVMTTASLSPPPPPAAPGAHDFRRAAWFDRLGAVGYARVPVLVVAQPEAGNWALAAYRLRMRLSEAIQKRIPGQPGAMSAAILTGDRAGLSEATREAMRRSNLAHLIAISGLHMGLLAGFVFALVRYGLALMGRPALIWPTKRIAAGVALVAATGYLWLSGAAVSTERAWIMVSVMLVAVMLDRRALSLRSVALAATILLVIEPESLIEPGFQMSFAATVALIVGLGRWGRVSRHLPRWLRPVAMLCLTSLIAGAATAPIVAAQFHRLSEFGAFANLVAVPVMGVLVMPAGVIAALLAPLGLAAPALWVMGLGTRWILFVAAFVANLDNAVIAIPQSPALVIPLLALGALLAVLTRGVARTAGGLMLALSACLWLQAPRQRPALLIAPEGELVGMMTPQGRVLSKTAARFVGKRWLEADGDPVATGQAAARPGFSGPRNARDGRFAGKHLVHVTGKGAIERALAACHDGALIVIAAKLENRPAACEIWDQTRLRRTGALALNAQGKVIARTRAGPRLWAP